MRRLLILILSLTLCLFTLLGCGDYSDTKKPQENPGEQNGSQDTVPDGEDSGGNEDDTPTDDPEDKEDDPSVDTPDDDKDDDTAADDPDGDENKPVITFPDGSLVLVENGKVNFNIVYDTVDFHTGTKREIIKLIQLLERDGVISSITYDGNPSNVKDCEILIGRVENRDGYTADVHEFGEEGFTIRVMDDKVIILGGTDESTAEAVRYFKENCLTTYGGNYQNVAIDRNFNYTHYQTYDVSSVSICGNDLSLYSIFYDRANYYCGLAARELQDILYKTAGYWLEITDEEGGRQIKFTTASKDITSDSFTASIDGECLVFTSQYAYLSSEDVTDFFTAYIGDGTSGDVSFDSGLDYGVSRHFVSYAEYGAVGDGVTDDFDAISAAHAIANISGQTVVAEVGKTYNMGAHNATIHIRTDTIWTGASFIIDDSEIAGGSSVSKQNIFTVSPSKSATQITGITSLKKGQTNVGVTFDAKYLLHIENSNIKQYIRYGENADGGANQQEVILVHPDGSIDPSTPLLWDYDVVTQATAYYADELPLTITGGSFYRTANKAERKYTYFNRGIAILRSNVTVTDSAHYISGEGADGAPYSGFLTVSCANNVRFENIIYSGHKTYTLIDNVNNRMGTYDISAGSSNAVTWYNCTQANSIYDKSLWGVMGSNYCKNLTYDGCTLSRFDAHKGMYNTTIINSEIGHAGITAIGAGDLLIENCIINSNSVVSLRGDYGSTWDGDVIIRNVELRNTSSTATLIGGSWVNHYFGYTCYLPHTVTVDNLTVAKGTSVYIFTNYGGKDISNPTTDNPIVITEKVTVMNNRNGYSFTVSSNKTVFGNTELIIK